MKRIVSVLMTMILLITLLPAAAGTVHAAGDVTISAANFPDANFREYVRDQFDSNSNGVLSQTEQENVTTIICTGKQIASLKGVEYFTNLETLNCGNNKLTSLDVSKNIWLTTLFCHDNSLTSLDVTKNSCLITLACSSNKISSLDLTKNSALKTLQCDSNQLSTLDISKNTTLTKLNCGFNSLTQLNLSNNPVLREVECNDNKLTSLNVKQHYLLEFLDCSDNNFTQIDVSNNTYLVRLYCSNNRLTKLDVSKNTALERLWCAQNQLTALDVSRNTSLYELDCVGNSLTTLNIWGAEALANLFCQHNLLSVLEVAGTPRIAHVVEYGTKTTMFDYISYSDDEYNSLMIDPGVTIRTDKKVISEYRVFINSPQPYVSPDYSPTFPDGAGYFCDNYNSSVYRNDVAWRDMTGSRMLDPDTDTFEPGHDYRVNIYLTLKEGYEFSDSPTCYVNNNTCEYEFAGSDPRQLHLTYTFKNVPSVTDLKYKSMNNNGVHLYWTAMPGADKYEISRYVAGSWRVLDTVTTTAYSDSYAQMGTQYLYRMRAYRNGSWTPYSNYVQITFNPFKDVKDTASYYNALCWAYNNLIINGKTSTTFAPNDYCTRAQFAAMLWKMHGKPNASYLYNPFKDVSESNTFRNPIVWCYHHGIVVGTTSTTFSPNANISRWQIMVMLWRLVGKPEVSGSNPFTDVKTTASYYKALLWAYKNGITSVKTFKPNDNCTRWQLVVFLYKVNEKYNLIVG